MRYLLLSFLIMAASGAAAQGVATFSYQRGNIAIARANPPALPSLPWQDKDAPRPQENSRVAIAVDIRPIAVLYRQAGWMNMAKFSETEGILFVLDRPETARVGRMEYFQPLDVLWIDDTGTITSIAPSLSVAALNEPMIDQKPSKALLMLSAGSTQKLGITPGDRISDSEYFQPPPSVVTLPK